MKYNNSNKDSFSMPLSDIRIMVLMQIIMAYFKTDDAKEDLIELLEDQKVTMEEMKTCVKMLVNEYREQLIGACQAFEAISGIAGISRNASYDIMDPYTAVRKDTITYFCLALEMSLAHYKLLLWVNGYCLKAFDELDQLSIKYFKEKNYDPDMYREAHAKLRVDIEKKLKEERKKQRNAYVT